MVFTKNLRPVLGLTKGSTLRLVGSGLKFCKEDLNMAAINFSPFQILKPGLRVKSSLKVKTFVSAKFCLKNVFTKDDLAKSKIIK